MYILPLEDRIRFAAKQRQRYWADDDFRLRQINRYRAGKGLPPLASLAELTPARRDAKGRFAK